MSKHIRKSEKEIKMLMTRIDDGILLAHKRLVKRAQHDNLSLVVFREGKVVEVNASEFNC